MGNPSVTGCWRPHPELGATAPHREVESGTLTNQALGPDPAPVPVYDPLHRSQPDAVSRKVFMRVQPLERPEEPVHICHFEACTVIPHEVGRLTAGLGRPKLDA